MNGPDIAVALDADGWAAALPGAEDLCRRVAAVALGVTSLPAERLEVSIVLADDATVRDLNRRYRNQDKPTNVLSFNAFEDPSAEAPPEGPILLGDVILAFETVRAEAVRDGKTMSQHLSHLVVHGVLHLLGYDHQVDRQALEMEALESALLGALGVPDPYAAEDS